MNVAHTLLGSQPVICVRVKRICMCRFIITRVCVGLISFIVAIGRKTLREENGVKEMNRDPHNRNYKISEPGETVYVRCDCNNNRTIH